MLNVKQKDEAYVLDTPIPFNTFAKLADFNCLTCLDSKYNVIAYMKYKESKYSETDALRAMYANTDYTFSFHYGGFDGPEVY